MLKPKLFFLVSVIALLTGCLNTLPFASNRARSPTVATVAPLSYEAYEMVLQTHVNDNGLVNYSALQTNAKPLQDFVAELGAVSGNTYITWSEPEKIAFLVNAYNAITLKSIIDQQPLKKSIKDIWGVWNLTTHTVMGQSKTLDNIEHQILRKDFNEPRIHAALVCAAMSCPPLRREPYMGKTLNAQLDDQVRKWLAGPHGIRIDRAQNRVLISSIFKWFGEDWQKTYRTNQFTGNEKERSVLNFISHYVSPADKDYLKQGQYKLGYLDYDWLLNRQ